jgi:gamma-glutamyltranspeptidase/glutathione hydrolase
MRIFSVSLLTVALFSSSICDAFAQTAAPLNAVGPVPNYLTEQPVRSMHAMVVSIHHLATEAGVDTLKRGGNAVDAAVAVAFTLAVVYPDAGNLGGGGFMLVHLSGQDGKHARMPAKDTFIDFREEAPGASTANMYLDANGNVVPEMSLIGPEAIGVPGTVAGMALAEKEYGRLGLKKVMEPAMRLAENGYALSAGGAEMLNNPHLRQFPTTQAIFGAKIWAEGDTFRQPELAKTLRRIASDPDSFYRGAMARQMAAQMKTIDVPITEQDLNAYHAIERTPILGHFDGQTIVSSPPPSSGGITLMETLNILDAPPAVDLRSMGDRSPQWIAAVTEAFRRAYMDRNAYLGDPAFVHMPIAAMLSPAYAEAWRKTITQGHATDSASLQRPQGFLPAPPTEGVDRIAEKPETTHFSVMDAEGNAVAVTTTLNGSFGSYETVPKFGFLLNDEMDDFTSKQGVPNMFGLIQGPANAIAPGKRPLSSMTPTIVLAKDGTVRMVLGSPGGSRIISTVANILLSVDEGRLNIQSAVDAPRFHNQYQPNALYVEPHFAPSIAASLQKMGYDVKVSPYEWSDGECIERDPATGVLTGGHDHRHGFGSAAGY